MPKGLMDWLNTKAGTTIATFLAGALVVLLATGRVPWPWGEKVEPVSGITETAVRAMLKDELSGVVETQKKQGEKLENLALTVENLKGRMQLAGLTSRMDQMGAGRRN